MSQTAVVGAGTVPLTKEEQAAERQRREEGRASDWLMQSEGLGNDAFKEPCSEA